MCKSIIIRKAKVSDKKQITNILNELDLVRPKLSINGFWVAEDKGKVASIAHIEETGDALFLSSVGVREDLQKRGIASRLLKTIFTVCDKNIYLYTVIPSFFKQLGFKEVKQPEDIPPRGMFGCDACEINKCVCMMRPYDAS